MTNQLITHFILLPIDNSLMSLIVIDLFYQCGGGVVSEENMPPHAKTPGVTNRINQYLYIERFSIECRETLKPKQLQWPITTNVNNKMNQRLEARPAYPCQSLLICFWVMGRDEGKIAIPLVLSHDSPRASIHSRIQSSLIPKTYK